MAGRQPSRAQQIEYQRRYFARPERTASRMAPASTPYVLRHFGEVVTAAGIETGQRVLEVGCGMGRFTAELVRLGARVTGADVSPDLLAELHERLGNDVATVCCDVAEAAELLEPGFDSAVGFFVLHHIPHMEELFTALAALVRPGGRIAFAEPNGATPLIYAQILLTPGMTWQGDGGVRFMRPGPVGKAMRRAGLAEVTARGYGFFPPFIFNRGWGRRLERALAWVPPVGPLRSFRLFSATVPR
jgi:SAM-dependent methyltransferase